MNAMMSSSAVPVNYPSSTSAASPTPAASTTNNNDALLRYRLVRAIKRKQLQLIPKEEQKKKDDGFPKDLDAYEMALMAELAKLQQQKHSLFLLMKKVLVEEGEIERHKESSNAAASNRNSEYAPQSAAGASPISPVIATTITSANNGAAKRTMLNTRPAQHTPISPVASSPAEEYKKRPRSPTYSRIDDVSIDSTDAGKRARQENFGASVSVMANDSKKYNQQQQQVVVTASSAPTTTTTMSTPNNSFASAAKLASNLRVSVDVGAYPDTGSGDLTESSSLSMPYEYHPGVPTTTVASFYPTDSSGGDGGDLLTPMSYLPATHSPQTIAPAGLVLNNNDRTAMSSSFTTTSSLPVSPMSLPPGTITNPASQRVALGTLGSSGAGTGAIAGTNSVPPGSILNVVPISPPAGHYTPTTATMTTTRISANYKSTPPAPLSQPQQPPPPMQPQTYPVSNRYVPSPINNSNNTTTNSGSYLQQEDLIYRTGTSSVPMQRMSANLPQGGRDMRTSATNNPTATSAPMYAPAMYNQILPSPPPPPPPNPPSSVPMMYRPPPPPMMAPDGSMPTGNIMTNTNTYYVPNPPPPNMNPPSSSSVYTPTSLMSAYSMQPYPSTNSGMIQGNTRSTNETYSSYSYQPPPPPPQQHQQQPPPPQQPPHHHQRHLPLPPRSKPGVNSNSGSGSGSSGGKSHYSTGNRRY